MELTNLIKLLQKEQEWHDRVSGEIKFTLKILNHINEAKMFLRQPATTSTSVSEVMAIIEAIVYNENSYNHDQTTEYRRKLDILLNQIKEGI